MSTHRTSSLSKPLGNNPISDGDLAYLRARHRVNAYDFVMKNFMKSGVTQATLAKRLGKDPAVINRLLGAPGNWTLDTISDLVFAICAAEPQYATRFFLDEPARNQRSPSWLSESQAIKYAEKMKTQTDQQDTHRILHGQIGGAIDALRQSDSQQKQEPILEQIARLPT